MGKMAQSHRRRRMRIIKKADEQSFNLIGGDGTQLQITELGRVGSDHDATGQDFLEDCRVNPETIVRLDRPGAAPILVKMDRPQLLIGSDPSCDLTLNDVAIRHHHCLLQWLDGHIFCCDLNRRSPSSTRRGSISNGCWIDHGPVSIGSYELSIVEPDRAFECDDSPLDRSSELSLEYPHLGFQFSCVDREDNIWPVDRPITLIGRSSICKLRTNHKSVHMVHACLIRTTKACWLVDLAKDETTCVNDRPIRVARIDVGDAIRIGSFQIEVIAMKSPTLELPIPVRESDHPMTQESPELKTATDSVQAHEFVSHRDEIISMDRPTAKPAPDLNTLTVVAVSPNQNMTVKSISIRIQPGILTSKECDSIIIQPTMTELPTPVHPLSAAPINDQSNDSVAEFATTQLTQLEELENHLRSLRATYDLVAPTLISHRTREALEKPVSETLRCCDEMRQILEKFSTHLSPIRS